MEISNLVSAQSQYATSDCMNWMECFGMHAGLHGQECPVTSITMKILYRYMYHCFEAGQQVIPSDRHGHLSQKVGKYRSTKLSNV